MAESERLLCTYRVDAGDRITSLGGDWLAFAAANDAPELTPEAVVGRLLWAFVAGEGTQQLYRHLMKRVRASGAPIVVPFRCDSPNLRRDMRLALSHLSGGTIEFRTRLVRASPRTTLALLDRRARRGSRAISMCSTCKRVGAPGGEWFELEDAVVRLRLLSVHPLPRLAHALCPRCATTLRALAAPVRQPPSARD
jgi:hypothetical protein